MPGQALWLAGRNDRGKYLSPAIGHGAVARPAAGRAQLISEQLHRLGLESPIIPLSQIDFADAVGLSVVHTNRVFQDLRKLGVLSESRCIEVVDKKRLQELGAFDVRYLDPSASLSGWDLRIEVQEISHTIGGPFSRNP